MELPQEIESVEVKPQEFTYIDELAGLAVFRLDFIATLRTEKGELKKVLIEIQKAKGKLENASFIDKAPEAVVAQEKKRLEEFEESFEKLNGQLKKLA